MAQGILIEVMGTRGNSVPVTVNQMTHLKAEIQKVKDYLFKFSAVQLISRTAEGAGYHDVPQRSAGVAYYAILSIFPLLLGLIAIFGFFLPSVNLQDELLNFFSKNLPGATEILRQNISGIIKLRGIMGVLSILLFFWSGSTMFSAMSLAINRVWNIRRYRPFFIRKASELGMAISTGVIFFLSLGASTVTSILRSVFNLNAVQLVMVDVGSRLAAFLLILAIYVLIYKTIPNVKTYWRYVWPGALFAAFLFEIARTLFILYLEKFGNYQLIYGSIASIIILLVWIYYSVFITILGAEFTYQYGIMRNSVTAKSGVNKEENNNSRRELQ